MINHISDKIKFTETPEKFEISIPAGKPVGTIIFFIFWLIGWFSGLQNVSEKLMNGDNNTKLFLTIWLAGWVIAGVTLLVKLIWMFAGESIILVSENNLVLFRKNHFLSCKKSMN